MGRKSIRGPPGDGSGSRVIGWNAREGDDRLRDVISGIGYDPVPELLDQLLARGRPHQHSVAAGFADCFHYQFGQVFEHIAKIRLFCAHVGFHGVEDRFFL